MRKNKKYARHLTKHERTKRTQITILVSLIIGVATIGYMSLLDAYPVEEAITISHKPKVVSQAVKQPKIVELITNKPDIETKIREIADKANFKWPDYLVKLAHCESKLDPKALGDSGKSRGLFQIHKGYHPEVSDKQAFDIEYATKWTMEKINAGYQDLWSCNKIVLARN